MSGVGGGDIPRPTSPHADVILGTLWPLQSESAWNTFAAAITAEMMRLFQEDAAQHEVLELVASDQDGTFITAAVRLIRASIGTLEDRWAAYNAASSVADSVASRIWATKLSMAESVDAAESSITAAKNELGPQIDAALAALNPAQASALTAELEGRITAAITQAQTEVVAAAADAAAKIAALGAEISDSRGRSRTLDTADGAEPMYWGSVPESPALPVPTDTSQGGYDTFNEGTQTLSDRMPETQQAEEPTLSQAAQDSTRFPDEVTPQEAASNSAVTPEKSSPSVPSAASASTPMASSSPAASSAGNPSSMLGAMTQQPTSSTSTAPAGSPASATSSSAPASVQTSSGGNISGAVRTSSAGASMGAGITDAATRMGTGIVSNALGAVINSGTQSAHSMTAAAAAPPPPASGSAVGGAPMAAMMPPGAVIASGLPPAATAPGASNVGPGLPGTSSSAQSGPNVTTGPSGTALSGSAASATPVGVPMSQVPALGGVDHAAAGDALIDQAAHAARSILESLIAQTRHVGYGSTQGFAWGVTVIAERSGEFTAWLATSDGPSYIPLGVRVPDDVGLAVNDPVVGRHLWDESSAAGGANPLEVLTRQAELRDASAPGLRVLVLASTLPIDRVTDFAAAVGARPVSVDPRAIDPMPAPSGGGQHRCAVAMPWEWKQAHAFSEQQRAQVAARQMLMAATAGHLTDWACQRVIGAFERGNPITTSDWADVNQARALAVANYDMARMGVSTGGRDAASPEWAFRTARAAEVVWCLRDPLTAEGCADLLYATRLAGAPLNPAAAVA